MINQWILDYFGDFWCIPHKKWDNSEMFSLASLAS